MTSRENPPASVHRPDGPSACGFVDFLIPAWSATSLNSTGVGPGLPSVKPNSTILPENLARPLRRCLHDISWKIRREIKTALGEVEYVGLPDEGQLDHLPPRVEPDQTWNFKIREPRNPGIGRSMVGFQLNLEGLTTKVFLDHKEGSICRVSHEKYPPMDAGSQRRQNSGCRRRR